MTPYLSTPESFISGSDDFAAKTHENDVAPLIVQRALSRPGAACRAACYTATKQHDKALRDARTCVQLKPDWPKAHYRLGRALLGLGGERTSEAVAAFNAVPQPALGPPVALLRRPWRLG